MHSHLLISCGLRDLLIHGQIVLDKGRVNGKVSRLVCWKSGGETPAVLHHGADELIDILDLALGDHLLILKLVAGVACFDRIASVVEIVQESPGTHVWKRVNIVSVFDELVHRLPDLHLKLREGVRIGRFVRGGVPCQVLRALDSISLRTSVESNLTSVDGQLSLPPSRSTPRLPLPRPAGLIFSRFKTLSSSGISDIVVLL
jgi:hypothetical protein